MYARVNQMFGDIVKVTPSSKVVGDMALFMVQNNLTEEDVLTKGDSIDFPDSVIELLSGISWTASRWIPRTITKGCSKRKRTNHGSSWRAS